ncbi:hypothetical protein O9501_18315 [Proteus mirabilis]|uniref:Uncharacterized protein n=1 Tax=uncultured prokaryote TaxID=198431 RepID=A0A0H5Q7L3_9ZZZZ|nr:MULTISPECIES: hypothetical protein [Enterobacterales]CRY97918.1 hypothetical protein [uncultured prokaryote]MDM3689583.1 hypothetical protein [Proteus mirabilis]MDM3814174.1 hypothetical protein [Proteus mirabilis]MDM3843382.1 hypothetical protein [Proteus mirabilis]MDX7495526.1 hypothetical protein [Providencia stuartii]
MKLKNWLIPLLVWIFIFIGIKLVFGSGCNDGWSSSSIGRMGACSHHGGVNHTSGLIAFILATIVSGWLFFKMDEVETRKIRKSYVVESSFFEMESTSAPFNPSYSLKINSSEINFTYRTGYGDGIPDESIKLESSYDFLKDVLFLSEKIKSDIDTFSRENSDFGCDGEIVSIRFFDGTKEVRFQTPMIFINFEDISSSTLKLMTTLRQKLKFDLY